MASAARKARRSPQSLLPSPHNFPESGFCKSSLINVDHCQRVFGHVLSLLYPCICECGSLCTTEIANRPYLLRCPKCLKQKSKLGHTPFRNLRVPQWIAGFLIEESFIRHPKVITAAEIKRRLGVSERTALTLKRRVQLLAAEQAPRIKKLIEKQLTREFKDFTLPPDGEDVSALVAGKKVVHADTLVLWSAQGRFGRNRFRHSGQTSSLFRSPRMGGAQIGTMAHVMGVEKGWCLTHSVSDQKANTIGPIIRDHLPINSAIFTDEGYPWLFRVYPNHRMINHSRKSSDDRFKFARDRWSRNGIHNQVAESLNSSLKAEMRAYRYFTPGYSSCYLNEWSFFKNLRYFGLEKIAKAKVRCADKDGGVHLTR